MYIYETHIKIYVTYTETSASQLAVFHLFLLFIHMLCVLGVLGSTSPIPYTLP